MMEFFESARPLAQGYVPAILFDAAIKGAVILTVAAALNIALRRAPAAHRHLVWSLSIVAVVTLPFLSALAPRWAVPGLPTLTPAVPAPAAEPASPETPGSQVPTDRPFTGPSEEREDWQPNREAMPNQSFVSRSLEGFEANASLSEEPASMGAVAGDASSNRAGPTGSLEGSTPTFEEPAADGGLVLPWTGWAALVWSAVALVVLAGIGLGALRTWLIGRAARRLDSGALVRLAEDLSARLGVKRRVVLLQCRGRCMPLTWGVIRPRILLPSDALAWPSSRLRAVLLHELAHVKRCDYVTQLLARFACAVHWFNPLVWHAANKLREERELACDDQVLRAGSLPSEYAGHLLELARSLKAEPLTALATVAMARPSQLGDRLRAVLDEGRARAKLSGRAKLSAWAGAALIVLPLAGASPDASRPLRTESVGESSPVVVLPPAERSTAETQRSASPERGRGENAWAEASDEQPLMPGPIPIGGETPEPRLRAAGAPRIGAVKLALASVWQIPGCDWLRSSDNSSTSVNINDDRMKMELRRGDCELSVDLEGELEFNASFTEIASLSRGGELEIEEKRGRESRRLLLTEDGGQLSREWYVNRDERTYDSEAQAWLSNILLVLFRRAGLQATERAEYILSQDGVDGLLREISQIPSDYTARKYYTVLLSQAELEPEQVREIVSQAGKEIDSDYELAELLIAVAENQPLDESVRIAYVEAAGSISSDYEHRRVLSAILKREDLSSELAQAMLASATNIGSDYELAELLIELLQMRPLDKAMTDSFFEAVGSIGSDYETRRVLEAALSEGAPSQSALDLTLKAAAGIGSDYELGQLLVRVADLYPMDARLPDSYVAAARSIGSDYELGRVLMTLLARGDLSSAGIVSVLDVATTIGSDYELGQVLASVARDYSIDDSVRPDFFRAANTISSDSELQRVLTTVLREQRLDDPLVAAVLESALEIDSDHELSTLLLELLDRHSVDGSLRPAFDRAVQTLSSSYERDRVLSAAYRSGGARN